MQVTAHSPSSGADEPLLALAERQARLRQLAAERSRVLSDARQVVAEYRQASAHMARTVDEARERLALAQAGLRTLQAR